MVNVDFYEKPGCINNTKQKRMLIDAGHRVQSINLLAEQWNKEKLLAFFDKLQVKQWFNISAPDIKSGLIDIKILNRETALELMIQNPILIRRPLMQVDNEYRVGFDVKIVNQWIGLTNSNDTDMERCPKSSNQVCDNANANVV